MGDFISANDDEVVVFVLSFLGEVFMSILDNVGFFGATELDYFMIYI